MTEAQAAPRSASRSRTASHIPTPQHSALPAGSGVLQPMLHGSHPYMCPTLGLPPYLAPATGSLQTATAAALQHQAAISQQMAAQAAAKA